MHVTRLDLRNLRRFSDVSLRPGRGLNLLTGDNGAGKTSVLEGLHLMAYGRSFRGRVRDGLIRAGSPALEVFVEWDERSVSASTSGREVGELASVYLRHRRAGLRHSGQDWTGRLDGGPVGHLGELCAALGGGQLRPG